MSLYCIYCTINTVVYRVYMLLKNRASHFQELDHSKFILHYNKTIAKYLFFLDIECHNDVCKLF